MSNDTDTEVDKSETVEDVVEETQDTTDYKALALEKDEALKELKGRLSRAESKLERDRLKGMVEDKVEKVLSKKEEEQTGELSNADYALLTAKGIEDDDEVELAQKYADKWKMPLRGLLKDDDFKAKLDTFRKEKEVKRATPTATKRAGQANINEVEHWLPKIQAGTAKLSDIPYETRVKILEERERREGGNTPPWRR